MSLLLFTWPTALSFLFVTGLVIELLVPSKGISNVDENIGSGFASTDVVVGIDVNDGVNVNENVVFIVVIVDDGVVIKLPKFSDEDVDSTDGLSKANGL